MHECYASTRGDINIWGELRGFSQNRKLSRIFYGSYLRVYFDRKKCKTHLTHTLDRIIITRNIYAVWGKCLDDRSNDRTFYWK